MDKSAQQTADGRQMRVATYAAVGTAMVLIAVKFGAWLWTGSVSILASLIDSLMDSVASVINLFAVRYSLTPADHEHRFGHGKAEPQCFRPCNLVPMLEGEKALCSCEAGCEST